MSAYGLSEFLADLKAMWKSWTVWFNTFVGIAVVALMDPQIKAVLESYLTTSQLKVLVAAVAFTNIALRFKTSEALRDK